MLKSTSESIPCWINQARTRLRTARHTATHFPSGLSTAEQVTQISGRGVGLDVVQSDIKSLGTRQR